MSRDGWRFEDAARLRWEPFYRRYDAAFKGTRPGYEYPSAVCHAGKLCVAYSVVRERIELSIVDLPVLAGE